MSIKEKLFKQFNQNIEDVKYNVSHEKISAARKTGIVKGVEYVFNRLTPIISEELEIIDRAYKKGLTNPNDGVFHFTAASFGNCIALSLEVANQLAREGTKIKKIEDEEQVMHLISLNMSSHAEAPSFLSNISFLNFHTEERQKEFVQEYIDTLDPQIFNKQNITPENMDGIFFDNNNNPYKNFFTQRNSDIFKQRLVSIENNTTEDGYSYNKRMMQKMGVVERKTKDGYYSSYVTDRFLFERDKNTYLNLTMYALEHSKELYSKKNFSALMSALIYMKENFYKIQGGSPFQVSFFNKIFNNIENFSTSNIQQLMEKIPNSFNTNRVKKDFVKRVLEIDVKKLERIEVDEENDISVLIKGIKANWKYDLSSVLKVKGMDENNIKYKLEMTDLRNVMFSSSLFNIEEVLVKLMQELNISINKYEDNYVFTIPNNLKIEEIMEFSRITAIKVFEDIEVLRDLTSNHFYEYLLSNKIKKIENENHQDEQNKRNKKKI